MLNRTTFWKLISDYKINISPIQRDYALGRQNEVDKRDKLLHNIHTHLTTVKKTLNLDFVYGTVEGDTFTPIDGQQRLITLFLLHWYLSVKENIDVNDSNMLHRFEYDSRTSSRDFCNSLVNSEMEIPPHHQAGMFAAIIKNKYWYRNAWNKDPSIQSMIAMIEAIHQKFHHTSGAQLWDCLKHDPYITFDWLDLGKKGHMLYDDLYVKMNARGKHHTPFENFKPRFIQFVASQYIGKKKIHSKRGEVAYADYFSYKTDHEWADMFWALRKDNHTTDDSFSGCLQYITQLLYGKNNQPAKADDFDNSFNQYVQVYSIEEHLMLLFDSLDKLYELVVKQGKTDKESIDGFIATVTDEVALTEQEAG